MIRRMLTTNIIKNLKEKEELKAQAHKIKKDLGANSPEFKKIKEKLTNLKRYYLEEDCSFLRGGIFRKGKDLTLGEAKRLLELGFHLIWVGDEPISEEDKKNNIIYNYKRELEKNLSKTMVVLDESNAKKPGSTINMIEGNDLIKQTIEALQMEGAKYLAQSIFGLSSSILDSIKTLLLGFYNKTPDKVDIFDNTCLGNIYKLKEIKDGESIKEQDKTHDEERTNYFLRIMINMGLAFMTTVSKIQSYRLKENFPNQDKYRRVDPPKRYLYTEEDIEEGGLASVFAVYGFLHKSIDKLIIRLTNPFYDGDGKLSGNGFLELNSKNRLLYEKHCNVSYNFFASLKDRGFVKEIGRGILQHHQRWLNDYGYPKRKMSEKKSQVLDRFGNTVTVSNNFYEQPINELTRLSSIIEFFLEYLFHTPFHIPFQRDNLVRYLILNSVYPSDSNNKPDKNGVFDVQSQLMQEKSFDGYLVDQFIRSINIYKINEIVPIYNFNNTNKKLYDAMVIRYNELAHRPVLGIVVNGKKEELDLSQPKSENLYIGEYYPSLRFQDVIEHYYLDKVSGGISIENKEKKNYSYNYDMRVNKEDKKTQNILSEVFEDRQVVEQSDTPDVDIDSLIASTLPHELEKIKFTKPDEIEKPMDKESDLAGEKKLDDISPDNLSNRHFDVKLPDLTDIKKDFSSEEDKIEDISIVEDREIENNRKNEDSTGESFLNKSDMSFEPPKSITEEPDLIDEIPKIQDEDKTMKKLGETTEPADNLLDNNLKELSDSEIKDLASKEDIQLTINGDINKQRDMQEDYTDKATPYSITKKLFNIYINVDNKLLPYGLGNIISSEDNEKKVNITYLAQLTNEDRSYYSYRYSLLAQKEQHIITVYSPIIHDTLPEKTLKFFITEEFDQDKKEQIVKKPLLEGEYYLLYYIKELDSSKTKNLTNNIEYIKGVPKYIVRIKEIDEQSNNPIVTFIRYIKIKDKQINCIKDKNCGKNFDLSTMPFFKLDRPLSAKDIVHFLGLSVI